MPVNTNLPRGCRYPSCSCTYPNCQPREKPASFWDHDDAKQLAQEAGVVIPKKNYRLWYRRGVLSSDYEWVKTGTFGEDNNEVTRSGTDLRRAGFPTITLVEGSTPSTWSPDGIRFRPQE